MGRAWMAIKDGIEQGIIFRKGLKEYCTGKKWGELADFVFRKNHRREEVLLLEKEELWQRLQGICEKVKKARDVTISSLGKRDTGITSRYYISVENLRSQPLQGVRTRLLMIDPQQSEILCDYDIVWSNGEYETKLFRGFPQKLLIFKTTPSPVILGSENKSLQITLLVKGKEEKFNLDKHFIIIIEVYGKDCYGVKGFFLHYHTPRSIQVFELVEVRSATYNIVFHVKREEATLEDQVRHCLKEFRFKFFRNPTVNEVATEIGEHPVIVERILYTTSPTTKWRPPTSEEIEIAQREAAEFLKKAAEIKYLRSEFYDRIDEKSPKITRKIKRYCEEYPQLLPEIWKYSDPLLKGKFEFIFPSMAKEIIGENGLFAEDLAKLLKRKHLYRKAGSNCLDKQKCSICGRSAVEEGSRMKWMLYHISCKSWICHKHFKNGEFHDGDICPKCGLPINGTMPLYFVSKDDGRI